MSTAQHTRHGFSPRWLRACSLLVVLILGGCQAGTTPGVSPSLPASASPSPTAPPTATPTAPPEPTPSPTPLAPHWEDAGTMTTALDAARAVAFPDGSVLVVGQAGPDDDEGFELWDAAAAAWRAVPGFAEPRVHYALVGLQDGRAMVIGGETGDLYPPDHSLATALVFDPAAPDAGWVMVGEPMQTARTYPSALVLADGRVLVLGGYHQVEPYFGKSRSTGTVLASMRGPLADVGPHVGAALATAELFDPSTNTWSPTGPMTFARVGAAVTRLADDTVLVAGSESGGAAVDPRAPDSTEIYDPDAGRFTLTGSLPPMDWSGYDFPHDHDLVPNYQTAETGSLAPLSDGGAVLIGAVGGDHGSGHYGMAVRSYRFSADDGSWREIGEPYLHVAWTNEETGETTIAFETEDMVPRLWPMVARLSDGRIVLAGGDQPLKGSTVTAQLYDPSTDSWSELLPMPEPRAAAAVVTLPDGSILIVGGHVASARPDGGSDLATVVRLLIGASNE